MLEQDRIGHAEIRTTDNHTVDVTAEATVSRGETELRPVALVAPQVEAREPQPTDGHVLETMTRFEHAQDPAIECCVGIDRRPAIFETEPAQARLADP